MIKICRFGENGENGENLCVEKKTDNFDEFPKNLKSLNFESY